MKMKLNLEKFEQLFLEALVGILSFQSPFKEKYEGEKK